MSSAIPVKFLLRYLNDARMRPANFAQYVQKELDSFLNDNALPLPGSCYTTNEGKAAWREAIDFLMNQEPLPPYELNQALCLSAQDHAIDLVLNKIFGHDGSDGSKFSNRIARRCGQQALESGYSGENIGMEFLYQGRNHALNTIVDLIVDDGVQGRGHRQGFFSKEFRYVGMNSRVHNNDKIITVFNFHSKNIPTLNPTPNPNKIGLEVLYPQTK